MIDKKSSINGIERTLLTVRQFSAKHPAFTEGSLRFNIFHADKNGFQACIRRIGRKILLDESEFFRWIDSQNECSRRVKGSAAY